MAFATIVLIGSTRTMAQFALVEGDPVDGHPVLVNGGLAGIYSDDGMEPAIQVTQGPTSDMYIAAGLVRLTGRRFLNDGVYQVRLFSHYHGDGFCKYAAKDQLKPEYVSACNTVRYRSCDLTVDTRARKFRFNKVWPCVFVAVDGAPLMGIGKPGFLPQDWVSFDALAKTKDGEVLKVIDAITATVQKIVASAK